MTTETSSLPIGFDDIGLRVGASLSIRPLEAQSPQTRYQVEYVGAIHGKSLLVTLPVVNGKGLWMKSGVSYVFHIVEGMYIYAFTGQVLRARNSPVPYVHFSWPSRIDARQVRKSYRVKMRLPVTVALAEARREVTLLDLSMTGALVEAPADVWAEGDVVSMILPVALEEARSQLSLPATIRNRVERPGGLAHFGLEFADLPQSDALLLHYYIDHTIAMRIG